LVWTLFGPKSRGYRDLFEVNSAAFSLLFTASKGDPLVWTLFGPKSRGYRDLFGVNSTAFSLLFTANLRATLQTYFAFYTLLRLYSL
jgi:hypothetical protein